MSIAADPTSARSLSGDASSYHLGVTAEVLERGRELAALTASVQSAAQGRGGVALVHGEAGIGKSTLVDALRKQLPSDARLLVGHCDDLVTPRVLGPLRDLSASVGAELAHVLHGDGDRDRLYTALRDELTWPGHATVLVIEDIHWVDDATLDVLRFLVRRVAELPTLLVLTYRDDLPREHPLHQLLALCHSSTAATDLALGAALGRRGPPAQWDRRDRCRSAARRHRRQPVLRARGAPGRRGTRRRPRQRGRVRAGQARPARRRGAAARWSSSRSSPLPRAVPWSRQWSPTGSRPWCRPRSTDCSRSDPTGPASGTS